MTLTVVPIRGARRILSMAEFDDLQKDCGVAAWIHRGKVIAAECGDGRPGAFDGG